MLSNEQKLIAVATLLLLLGAFQLILLPSLMDEFRQRIFCLRRELFLLVSEGDVDPSTPAYTHLRTTMNGVLRFTERLTVLRLLLHGTLFRNETRAYSQKLHRELSLVEDDRLREKLMVFRRRLGQEIIRHVLVISPLAWIAAVVVAPVLLLLYLFRGVQSVGFLMRRAVSSLAEHLSVQGVEAQAEALIVRR